MHYERNENRTTINQEREKQRAMGEEDAKDERENSSMKKCQGEILDFSW